MNKLSKNIEMGLFELNVKNLDLMKDFYHLLVGLEIIEETNSSVILGFNQEKILKLNLNSSVRVPKQHEVGLYHSALAFSDRPLLAKTIQRILINYPSSYSGSADHLVSEAFYFYDPEGNGLELYFDKDQENWIWKDGHVLMDTLFLNVKEYLDEYSNPSPIGQIIKTGHIHLKVGSLEEAEKFYLEVLGFVKVSEFPGAIFISDGKYHHHLGINIWESKAASRKDEETLGLKSFEIILENKEDLLNLASRLDKADTSYTLENNILQLQDPWNNLIKFKIKSI